MKRTFQLSLAAAAVIAAVACSGSNDPATETSGDGDGDVGDGDVGDGDTSTSGGAAGDGDAPAAGGAAVGDGDAPAAGGAAVGDGDGDGTLGNPPCGNTLAGTEIAKGVACTPEDVQLCWRTCGPEKSGWKSETCTGGAYAEGDCQFPPGNDYSCYAIDDPQDAACPSTTETMPQASQLCDVPECSTCNYMGQYKDSGGAVKEGYCVCQAPNGSGERKWSCGSATAWPCPLGNGC